MRHVRLFLRDCQALDVSAYRSNIYVLRFDGRIAVYSIARITEALESKYKGKGLAASYALFSSSGIGASAKTRSSWQTHADEEIGDTEVDLEPELVTSFSIPGDVFRDFRAYYNQLFVGSDRGVFSIPIGEKQELQDPDEVDSLIKGDVEALAVGLGAVGASLGHNGLAILPGIYSREPGERSQIDAVSLRASLGWGMATNYPSHRSYQHLEMETFEDNGIKYLSQASLTEETNEVELTEADFVYWESGRALEATNGFLLTLGKHIGKSSRLGEVSSESVISIAVTGNRAIVAESASSVYAVLQGSSHRLLSQGPIALRTFSSSFRFKRLIAATVDNGVSFNAVYPSNRQQY